MANQELMNDVGRHCDGYNPVSSGMMSAVNSNPSSKSCGNCSNFQNQKCVKNLFDKVAASLDQS